MFSQSFVPLGYQQITDISAAQGLTVPTGANFAIITVESTAARWRDDGTAPTAAIGLTMAPTDSPLHYSGSLSNIKFIQQTATAKLNVSYYRIVG